MAWKITMEGAPKTIMTFMVVARLQGQSVSPNIYPRKNGRFGIFISTQLREGSR
jgi:hypothetical protein